MAVAQLDPRDGSLGGFQKFFEESFLWRVALDPITPVAMADVVVEFVVNDFTNKLAGRHRRLSRGTTDPLRYR